MSDEPEQLAMMIIDAAWEEGPHPDSRRTE